MLRRTKKVVLKDLLPDMEETEVFLDMCPRQNALYNKTLQDMKTSRVVKKAAEGPIGTLYKIAQHPLLIQSFFGTNYTLSPTENLIERISSALSKVRNEENKSRETFVNIQQLSDLHILHECIHGYTNYEDKKDDKYNVTNLADNDSKDDGTLKCLTLPFFLDKRHSMALRRKSLLRAVIIAMPSWIYESSAKMTFLKTFLPEKVESGHRILIFSQLKDILDILEHLVSSLQLSFLRIDGDTNKTTRTALIDTFNAKDCTINIFLLSTKAGGLGINLQTADTVVLHDSDYNPTADDQAICRAHRIGQTSKVNVVRLFSKDTVDIERYNKANVKRRLEKKLLND